MVCPFPLSCTRVFTLGHELKHYLVDKDIEVLWCGDNNRDSQIKIGAEVFAAELLFPDFDFEQLLIQMGVEKGDCNASDLVHLKRSTEATLSYAGLVKKAEFLNFIKRGSMKNVNSPDTFPIKC